MVVDATAAPIHPQPEPLWTAVQVAEYLNVREGTVRQWVIRRKIPFRKVNGALRFVPAEIRALVHPENNDDRGAAA